MAQESLRNIAKHAEATKVRVAISGEKARIGLRVEDTGDGFDLKEAKGKGGLGLISMEERVRLLNGKFTIESQPGEGTTVEVFLPFVSAKGTLKTRQKSRAPATGRKGK